MKITVSTMVEVPIAEAWRAYTSPEDIKAWNTASPDWHTTESTVDLRVGGKFSSRMEARDGSFGFDFAGEYTKVVPHSLLEYTFGGRVGLVEFVDGPFGVTVKVTFDSESSHSEEQQHAGWQAILDNFAQHVARAQARSDRLFRFPAANKKDPAVDAWFDAQSAELGSIARFWFGRMRGSGDEIQELIHDGCPVACVGEVAFGYVNVFTSHANVGFFCGADLDDPADLLEGTGKRMRHVKLRPGSSINAGALQQLIEEAYLNVKRRTPGRST